MKRLPIIALLLATTAIYAPAASLGTSFNYQGRLNSGTNPVTGKYDLKFALYDSLTIGSLAAGPVTNTAVGVTNGLFTVGLDFGNVFNSRALWLETSVRTNGIGVFTLLSPRQALAPAPYALYAPVAGTAEVASTVVAGGVTSGMLANGAVTSGKIGPAAVKASNIDDGDSAAYESLVETARSLTTAELLPFSALSFVTTNGGTPPAFSLTLDAAVFGTVTGFVGHERISEPYEFVIEVTTAAGAANPDSLIGRQGRLTFTRNGQTTSFAGVVTGSTLSSSDGTNALYTIRLAPVLSYLALSTDYAVSQQVKVPELVASLYHTLTADTLTPTLSGSYTKRDCIQYGETALNFVNRLLEDEGIFYFFLQGAGAPALVLGDSPSAFPAASYSSLSYYGDQGGDIAPGAEFIRTFQRSTRNATRTSTIRDYDFKHPSLKLEESSEGPAGRGEDYEFGSPWKTATELKTQAKHREERYQLERVTQFGSGNAAGLRAGYTFELDDRSGAGVGNIYLVTAVQHAGFRRITNGVASFFYGNQFEVIPSPTPYRPPFKAPRPMAQPCPAIVTGPVGEEIHVDNYGRIKVQFYWDRLGTMDDQSSAWVRVASPWAGSGHGMLFLPRVGDEVLVGFVGGNPDQPVITGSFYNAENPVPYALPGNKTISSIKTQSSKGGGGNNEIRFQDLKGAEQLIISATKDLGVSAAHDLTVSAANNLAASITKDLQITAQTLNLTASQGIGIGVPNDPALALNVNGIVAASSFQGSGAGLINLPAAALSGTIPDARLSANIALRSGGNTLTGAQVITSGSLRMSDQGIFFRGGSDILHGLGWFASGSFAGANPDGPVLFGCAGGGLGSMCSSPFLALTWNSQGNVALDPTGANTGALTPGLTFGPNGKEGIASKRSAGGNQSGLDFYTAGTNRLSLTSSGSLGLGTTNPARRMQIVDADGISGSLQVGANIASANPKLIYFGDGDYVHIGENGADDRLELKGTVILCTASYVGIGNTNPTNTLMVGTARCDGLSWINASDRNAKENFKPVASRTVLAKVAAMPISRWSYKHSDGSTHLGPVAQDFHAAFDLGVDDTSIATVDADGVALAAIQGLNEVVQEKDAEIQALKQRLERLEKLVTGMHR